MRKFLRELDFYLGNKIYGKDYVINTLKKLNISGGVKEDNIINFSEYKKQKDKTYDEVYKDMMDIAMKYEDELKRGYILYVGDGATPLWKVYFDMDKFFLSDLEDEDIDFLGSIEHVSLEGIGFVVCLLDFDKNVLKKTEEVSHWLENNELLELCGKYKKELQDGDWLFLAEKLPNGMLRPLTRCTYAKWMLEDEEYKDEEPFYIDSAEADERGMFDRVVNE
jgi:hypothetical protein